jgi:GrpB-like predicted nucleotidyltransferase (UPF0157 family)
MIQLSAYQKNWQDDYARTIADLSQVLDLTDVDHFKHIGSTAVPGLTAKPVIDIMLGVNDINEFNKKNSLVLERLGYDYVQTLEQEFPYRRYFQLLNAEGEHQVHLHVVTSNSCFWRRHLLFRNYLRLNKKACDDYIAIKKQAINLMHTRDDYTAYKSPFVYAVLRQGFINRQLNPSYFDSDVWTVTQPEACMTSIVNSLYPDDTQVALSRDINHWDHYGYGIYWWQHKSSGEWVGRAGFVASSFGAHKRKWVIDFVKADFSEDAKCWRDLADR